MCNRDKPEGPTEIQKVVPIGMAEFHINFHSGISYKGHLHVLFIFYNKSLK